MLTPTLFFNGVFIRHLETLLVPLYFAFFYFKPLRVKKGPPMIIVMEIDSTILALYRRETEVMTENKSDM